MKIFINLTIYCCFGTYRTVTQPALKFKLSDWLKNDNKELISDFGCLGREILQIFGPLKEFGKASLFGARRGIYASSVKNNKTISVYEMFLLNILFGFLKKYVTFLGTKSQYLILRLRISHHVCILKKIWPEIANFRLKIWKNL